MKSQIQGFTNQATLQNWPVIITVVDLAWGSILTGTASVIATKMARYLLYFTGRFV